MDFPLFVSNPGQRLRLKLLTGHAVAVVQYGQQVHQHTRCVFVLARVGRVFEGFEVENHVETLLVLCHRHK